MRPALSVALLLLQKASSNTLSPGLILLFCVVLLIALLLIVRVLKTDHKPKPLTALVCGASGVGKSTLINTLLGRNIAQTGIGAPVTQNTVEITDPSGNMVFFDSKGLEVEDASQTYLLLLSDLLRLRFRTNPLNQVDIVLMCIQETQGRIDDAHLEIAALCEDLKIPLGIVITKKLDDPELELVVRRSFPKVSFVRRVRALDLRLGNVVLPTEGLPQLLEDMKSCITGDTTDAKRRAHSAGVAQYLASIARRLGTSSGNDDSAWINFASEAWRSLRLKPKWSAFLKQQRNNIQKLLVPKLLKRTFNTKFEPTKIEGAIARRLIPVVMRRFAEGSRALSASDVNQACVEAAAILKTDRPYRSRF